MENSVIEHGLTNVVVQNATQATTKHQSNVWEMLEYNRFGMIPVLITVVACFGGFAGAFAILQSPLKLALVVLSTGITEAFILGMMPMKKIMLVTAISLAISLLAIIL